MNKQINQIEKTIISVETGFIKIGLLDSRAIVKLLNVANQQTLAKALRGAPDNIGARVIENMSSLEGSMLLEDMEWLGPILKNDVIEAQKEIFQIVRNLEQQKEIVIPDLAEEYIVD